MAAFPAFAEALAESGAKVRIDKVETFPVLYPLRGHFKFFDGPPGRPAGRAAVLVKITTEDGTFGWGQSVPIPKWSYETVETVTTTIQKYLAPELHGRDPFEVAALHKAMNQAIAPSFSTGQPICKAGIDLALLDLAGRITGKSVAAPWGKSGRKKLTLSWTLNPRSLDEVESLIEEGRKAGYRNFNIKVGPDPKIDLELARMVKRLVPEGFLWADANGGYDEATALAVTPKLADAGVVVFEQPLPANRLGGYRRLKQQGALPIIMDEGIVSSVELEEFIEMKLLDGVAMKPARCGGLTEARHQIEIVKSKGLMFLGSGLTDPDVSLAASLLLYGAFDLKYPAALNGPQFLEGSVLKEPLKVVDGEMQVPTGPGLGVEVDEAKVAALRLQA
jgi:L-alanine-DL-glutamate epimerase-like enolase superfamily enzyme